MSGKYIKSAEALAAISQGGKILGKILSQVAAAARVGVGTKELDQMAEELIRDVGGRSAFLGFGGGRGVKPYPATVCISVNDEVIHGIPTTATILASGDVVGFDIGMEWPYKKGRAGFFTDTAMTVGVGKISEEDKLLLTRTRGALFAGMAAAQAGQDVRDISQAIENYLQPYKYGIVRDLVGHGVGYEVHEEPAVPNFVDKSAPSVPLLPGMVLAIEPMVTRGGWQVITERDGWTIKTADHTKAAHFEHTIIITPSGAPEIVTLRPEEL